MVEKTYVCGYSHCLHKGEKINKNDAVIVGNRRFHTDCADLHCKINKMKDLYYENIDDNVEFVTLMSVINNIIFNKRIDPDYMLFALNHVINRKIKIKSPYLLHYLPDNKIIISLWNKGEGRFDNR